MSRDINRRVATGLAAGVCGVGGLLGAAIAVAASTGAQASSKGTIKAVPRSTAGATKLVRAIFEGKLQNLGSARFVTVPPDHDPVAISTKKLDGFPRGAPVPRGRGKAFAILSTGCAHLADHPNNSDSTSCADGGILYRGARDATVLRIRVNVPKSANCLSFRFRFLSEEYPEWVGSEYNDAFLAELDKTNWNAASNTSPTITAPNDFATTGDGKLISVNATGIAHVSPANAKGTTYDAATRVLRASKRVRPGSHYLYLTIFNQPNAVVLRAETLSVPQGWSAGRGGGPVARLNEHVTMRLDPLLGCSRLATGELVIGVRLRLRIAIAPGAKMTDDADLSLLGGHAGLVCQ